MEKSNRKLIIGQLLQIYLPMILLIAGISVTVFFLLSSGQNPAQNIQTAGGIAAVYLMFLFAGPIVLFMAVLFVLIALNFKISRAAKDALPKLKMKAININESAQSVKIGRAHV